jgi:hypothetical protein
MNADRLDALAFRQLSARHVSSVHAGGGTTEGNQTDPSIAIDRNSDSDRLRAVDFEAAYARAIDAGGLDDKGAAALMHLSPGQLSRQLRGEPGYHLSVQRLEHLPRESQVAFVQFLAQRLGLDVTIPDADALILSELLLACSHAVVRFRMLPATMRQPAVRRVG